jgi:multiple sugar transport system substrate-binding protein
MKEQIRTLTRRDFLRLTAVTAGGALLAACGPAPATEAPKAEATKAPEEVATQAPAAGQTVRMGVWASPEEFNFFQEWVKPFQDKTGITVKIEYVDWTTYWTKLPTQFSAGNATDVIEMSNYIPQFGPQGVLADLKPLIERDKLNLDDYVKVPFEKFTYQGKLLSFPMGVTIQMLAYNIDVFDKAGEKYPTKDWTWNDMLETATKLTVDKNGKHPNESDFDPTNVTQWGISMSLDEESGWAPLVFQNGANYWNADYTVPNFTDPKVVEAFQFLADMINKYHVAPSPTQSQKFGGDPFMAGQAAMTRMGTYMLVPLKDNIKSFKWDVTVPPKGKQKGVFVDGIGWSLNAATKAQDAAWSLIKYFLTDGQTFMGERHWQVPIYKPAFKAFAVPPPDHVGDLAEQFDYGYRWPSYKNGAQVDDIIGQVTTQLWDGKLTAQEAAQQIQEKVAPLVK